MEFVRHPRLISILFAALACSNACSTAAPERAEHPRLTPQVTMRDEVFHSAALHREMRYRVIWPTSIAPERKLPAVYLLHGAGADWRDWSNDSDVAQQAEAGLILVMPQGDYSYYVNAAGRPADRYEDYIVQDLIADVEANFPAASGRSNRAIVGVSMGGFGAIKLALSHPGIYAFAGALSPAIDAPRRSFSFRRFQQSWEFRAIFGPSGGEARRRRDPFLIARDVPAAQAPYIFLSCGDGEKPAPAESRVRRTSFGTALAIRVSRRTGRPRLEPVEHSALRVVYVPETARRELLKRREPPGSHHLSAEMMLSSAQISSTLSRVV